VCFLGPNTLVYSVKVNRKILFKVFLYSLVIFLDSIVAILEYPILIFLIVIFGQLRFHSLKTNVSFHE